MSQKISEIMSPVRGRCFKNDRTTKFLFREAQRNLSGCISVKSGRLFHSADYDCMLRLVSTETVWLIHPSTAACCWSEYHPVNGIVVNIQQEGSLSFSARQERSYGVCGWLFLLKDPFLGDVKPPSNLSHQTKVTSDCVHPIYTAHTLLYIAVCSLMVPCALFNVHLGYL